MRSVGEMDPVAMNTTVYFIWKVVYCCHMDSNCIGITNGLAYIGLHRQAVRKSHTCSGMAIQPNRKDCCYSELI